MMSVSYYYAKFEYLNSVHLFFPLISNLWEMVQMSFCAAVFLPGVLVLMILPESFIA